MIRIKNAFKYIGLVILIICITSQVASASGNNLITQCTGSQYSQFQTGDIESTYDGNNGVIRLKLTTNNGLLLSSVQCAQESSSSNTALTVWTIVVAITWPGHSDKVTIQISTNTGMITSLLFTQWSYSNTNYMIVSFPITWQIQTPITTTTSSSTSTSSTTTTTTTSSNVIQANMIYYYILIIGVIMIVMLTIIIWKRHH